MISVVFFFFFFFKQKTAYEIVDCDWSSDVCSSDLPIVMLFALAAYTINYNEKVYEVILYCAYDNCCICG